MLGTFGTVKQSIAHSHYAGITNHRAWGGVEVWFRGAWTASAGKRSSTKLCARFWTVSSPEPGEAKEYWSEGGLCKTRLPSLTYLRRSGTWERGVLHNAQDVMDDPVVRMYQHSGRCLQEMSLEDGRIIPNKEWALVHNTASGQWEVWVNGEYMGHADEARARHQMGHYLRGERCFQHLWSAPKGLSTKIVDHGTGDAACARRLPGGPDDPRRGAK